MNDELTRDQVIRLAMQTFGWTERKCTDWFKLEIKGLNYNSPMELVNRKETGKIVELLNREARQRNSVKP